MQNRSNKSTILLTRPQIEKMVNLRQVLRIVEKAFAAHGRGAVQMPPKIYLHLNRYKGDFRAMPAYVEDTGACGMKWVNVHPGNRTHGLPAVMAIIILSDPRTGYPAAIMDGTYITNLRTGASGGVAAKYLANRSSSNVGFVGCGVQAMYQFLSLREIFDIKTVAMHDKSLAQAKRFMTIVRQLGYKAECFSNIKGCVSGRDVVVTTTPSRKPLIKAAWISPGTHINAIGADAKGKEELDPSILKKARIVVDDMEQAAHSGEINVPLSKGYLKEKDIYATLGQVVIGKRTGRSSPCQITVFDSTGLAIQDMAVASYVYKRSLAGQGRLRKISFL